MATYGTKGIIIGRHNFGEADRVIVILTPGKGVVRAVAKGVRRIKSRMAGHLELFNRSELMLAEGKNMDVITSARLQKPVNVGSDYDKMRLAYLMAEMANRLGSDGEHPGLYDLMDESLDSLDSGVADQLLELWFKLRLLDVLGYRPELGECIECHSNDPEFNYRLDISHGGIVCDRHSNPSAQLMTHEMIKFWRVLLGSPVESARKIRGVPELAKQSIPLCNLFYDHTFGKRFRSSEVLT